jgi:N-acetylmuramoyl-L-alanine amidase
VTPPQAADLVFLALDIWREARGCPTNDARVAVGGTVLNRVARPSWWGASVLQVLFKKWQYSSLTAPGDPQLTTWPLDTDPSWAVCLALAGGLLNGTLVSPYPNADSYYDISIPPPSWATPDMLCGKIGRLCFYNLDRDTEPVPVLQPKG